jgi:NTP pyrophosphatase (non-canonical NTP hydrolase)
MSELSDFQKEVGEWGDETFNAKRNYDLQSCSHGIYKHLVKEVKELYDALRQKFVSDNPPTCSVEEELADCFIILIHLAHLHGFDLLEAARNKMDINRKRTWGEPDEDGVIEHIK